MNQTIRPVLSTQLGTFWRDLEGFVTDALHYADDALASEDIRKLCESRDMQMWVAILDDQIQGAATTEVVQYPRRKMVRVVTLAGDRFPEWRDDMDRALQAFAERVGANGIEIYGRKGWEKRLDDLGYKPKGVRYAKELHHV
jgi:hypothetical protein